MNVYLGCMVICQNLMSGDWELLTEYTIIR